MTCRFFAALMVLQELQLTIHAAFTPPTISITATMKRSRKSSDPESSNGSHFAQSRPFYSGTNCGRRFTFTTRGSILIQMQRHNNMLELYMSIY